MSDSYTSQGHHEEAQVLWHSTHVSAQKVGVDFEELRTLQTVF